MNKYEQMQSFQHLEGLNEQQKEAVLCHADILYVSAGPGTGKSTMLVSKLIDYIESSHDPQKIVAISFTNTAARQIGDRFRKKVQKYGIMKEFSFFNGTIHSFCFRMMKSYCSDASKGFDYIILDDDELQELSSEIQEHYEGRYSTAQILSCLRSVSWENSELADGIKALKESYKVISIQDILTKFTAMLNQDEGFQRWIRKKVSVIAVDEAQDLSEMNYVILDNLIRVIPGLKVLLVGDPRQNIFEFNGGSYKNLDEFLSRHQQHEKKHLTITYRCCQAISDYVNTFQFSDCDNEQLQSRYADAGKVIVRNAMTEEEEASQILRSIKAESNLNSCAVLSNNLKYMDLLIDRLIEEKIPYKVFGGRKTIKKHIRFLNHILRILDSDNAYSIRKIAQYAGIDIMENGKRKKSLFFQSDLGRLILSIREMTAGLSFIAVIAQVIARIMYDPDDSKDVRDDYDRLLEVAGEFDTISDYLVAFATDKDKFAPFFQKTYKECPYPNEQEYLTLSTIHSAKGLEWKHVFIIGLCEGNFPNPFFCQGMPLEKQEEFFNGEWKKMYVASTRAKESLVLSYPSSIKRKGYTFKKLPSRFIQSFTTN